MDDLTKPPEELAAARRSGKLVPCLVVVWSAEEPSRLGEVAFFAEPGEYVLGRGAEGQGTRVAFFRARPDSLSETSPLRAQGISREQLALHPTIHGLLVRRRGLPAMRINGALVEEGLLAPGDVVEIDRQLLLLCTDRPPAMPALRHGHIDMRFGEPDPDGILGESPAAWALRDSLAYAAAAVGHVLVQGESGVGKELAARAIHDRGGRRDKPFVSHSAATFPSGLIDAELFGNARNYPNPGMPERGGLVGDANGGILFLDEIGELPAELHARLLRVLDDGGEYRRLGESKNRHSDFRLVTATNRDPSALKHDLLSRLRVRVAIPSLRERREDVPFLVRAIILEAAAQSPETAGRFVATIQGRPEIRLTSAFADRLVRYPYSTNTREIAILISAAMEQSPDDILDIPKEILDLDAESSTTSPPPKEKTEKTADDVRAALEAQGGNVSRAAAALGLSRQALYRLIAKYGLKAS